LITIRPRLRCLGAKLKDEPYSHSVVHTLFGVSAAQIDVYVQWYLFIDIQYSRQKNIMKNVMDFLKGTHLSVSTAQIKQFV
jgi:hypothetical protein